MSLMETLKKAQIDARKARDTVAAGLLTSLIGEAARVGKDAGDRESTDEEVESTIRKFVKNAEEMRIAVEKRGDADKIAETAREIEILTGYLPKQATDEEVSAAITAFKGENPDAKIGQYMGHLRASFGKNFDAKRAQALVQQALA